MFIEYEYALDGLMCCSVWRKMLDKQRQMRCEEGELGPDAQAVSPANLRKVGYFGINYEILLDSRKVKSIG